MKRILMRQDEMIALFSRMRNRTPLLETTAAWFLTIEFSDLATLAPAEQRAVNIFYGLLSELRWYLAYTEDMPGSLNEKVTLRVRQLEVSHRELVQTIGSPEADGAAVVQATAVKVRSTGLARTRPSRRR